MRAHHILTQVAEIKVDVLQHRVRKCVCRPDLGDNAQKLTTPSRYTWYVNTGGARACAHECLLAGHARTHVSIVF